MNTDPELIKHLKNMHRGMAMVADNIKKMVEYLEKQETPTRTKHNTN